MTVNIQLTLNSSGVAAPALSALRDALEVVTICFPAIDGAKEMPHLENNGMEFRFKADGLAKLDERRPVYKQWMLSKGFHEIAKGLRRSLEEAYLYVEVPKVVGLTKWGELQAQIDVIKRPRFRCSWSG